MFTGLIQHVGKLVCRETAAGGLRLVIQSPVWQPPLAVGESLAVDGACLTIARIAGMRFACDILGKTCKRTTLGAKRPGAALNLERALRLGEALGGHLITGHVDGAGTVSHRQARGRDWILRVSCAAELLRGMVWKGSIAIDGVSLTITELDQRGFAVELIPFTCRHTTLDKLRAGDKVNLETDLIGKHVRRCLETGPTTTPLTGERLRAAGFGES
ncbi:MAG: riboflavin synthase [Lentisphaerae bacterium]|nr:riboflavin synthase [Lentisphaerota bacterium]